MIIHNDIFDEERQMVGYIWKFKNNNFYFCPISDENGSTHNFDFDLVEEIYLKLKELNNK